MSIIITYLDHSGFSVETDRHIIAFDDVKGEWPKINNKKNVVFVSHKHRDHFTPAIYDCADESVEYVMSGGISKKWRGHRMKPLDVLSLDETLTVSAFGSTDEGVSYWVRVDGLTVFHAGDLNWWHWQDESTPDYIEEAGKAFKAVIETLPKPESEKLDIAFFPVDPRLGTNHDAGARYFAEVIRPRYFFPMHFWKNAKAAQDFTAHSNDETKVIPLTEHMQTYKI